MPKPTMCRDALTESHEWAARAADLWWSIVNRYACMGLFPKLYLYVRDNEARDPAWLTDWEAPDPAWTLANAEPASPAWTRGKVGAWIRSFVGRLPILPAVTR